MKLLSVKLTNYIGIANGTGLRELYIDFTACKPIIAIVGHNGSGKSTLLKSLHPFPDSYDMLIPNCEAYKELVYLKDNHIYEIKIKYTHMDKNSTEVAIFKDRINLNPNLNVTNAKDIIMNEFELDSNYIALSQLSSEDRGLADKRPSERKKFVNDILSDLSVYNTMYKTLNKKSGMFKNLLNNLSYKINNLGGNNLPLLESNVIQLGNQLHALETEKENAISEQTIIANKLEENKDIVDKCNAIKNQYEAIGKDHMVIIDKINKFKMSAMTQLTIDWEDKDLSTLGKATIEKINADLIALNAKRDSINDLYQKASINYQSSVSDKISKQQQLNSIQQGDVDIDAYLTKIKKLEEKKATMKKWLFEVSPKLLNSKNNSNTVNTLYQDLSDIHYELTKLIYYKRVGDVSNLGDTAAIKRILAERSEQMNAMSNEMRTIESNKIDIPCIDHVLDIPDNCNNKECYFYKSKCDYLQMRAKIDEQYKAIETIKSKMQAAVEQVSRYNDYLNELNVIEKYEKILSRNSNIIDEIDSIKHIERSNIYANDAAALSEAVISALNGYNYLDGYNNLITEYSEMMENYMALSRQIDIIVSLKKDIEIASTNTKKYQAEANEYSNQIQTLDEQIRDLSMQLSDANIAYQLGVEFDNIQILLLKCKQDYDANKQAIADTAIMQEDLNKTINKINSINTEIANVKQAYDNARYSARMLAEYQQEYNTYINDFQKIETIKKFTSPTTGIQTLFMETYMNNVLIIANQLLGLMFNGEFMLQPFIINEYEFRIPCAGSGYLNDDISSMSTSQICIISMIISFAMLYNSSSCYNILKLDEIDGGLDNDNRIKFVGMLEQVMNIMQCQQCFIISHNMELDESQVSKIDMNSF